jgi:hypothetical protein
MTESDQLQRYTELVEDARRKFDRDYNLALAKKDVANMRYVTLEYLHKLKSANKEYGQF